MYKKTVNGHEIEITESQYKGQLNLSIRDENDRLVFNLDLDLDDNSIPEDESCYGYLVRYANGWVNCSTEEF